MQKEGVVFDIMRYLIFALVAIITIGFLVWITLSVKIAPMRVFCWIAFLAGLANPWAALVCIVFLGPLCLLDSGSTYRLVQTEVFLQGAFLGYFCRWANGFFNTKFNQLSIFACLSWLLCFGVIASSVPGIQLLFWSDESSKINLNIDHVIYSFGTWPAWSLRSAYNWMTGLLLAWMVSKMVTLKRAKVLLIAGSVGTFLASCIGLFELIDVISLGKWRLQNMDPLHREARRLVGFAGHAGWFAEWIVLTWPGLLFIWGRKQFQKILFCVMISVIALALFLTLARAGWLAGATGGVMMAFFLCYRKSLSLKTLLWITLGIFLLMGITVALNSDAFLNRFYRILDFEDRKNYWISSLHLARWFPKGVGIGLHAIVYESRFFPFHELWQSDHVTAHNTWLHVWVEQGPFQAIVLLIGMLGILGFVGWKVCEFQGERSVVLFCFWLIILAVFVESWAQYLGFIRVVELMVWMSVGSALGIIRNMNIRKTIEKNSLSISHAPKNLSWIINMRNAVILGLGGTASMLVAQHHAQKNMAYPPPRPFIIEEEGSLGIWTANRWRFPIDPRWCGVELTVWGGKIPQDVVAHVPNHSPHKFHLEPGAYQGLWFDFYPNREASALTPFHWLEIECAQTWVPSEIDPSSDDHRRLGVYISGLRPFYCDDDPKRPTAQTWKESIGGMTPRIE